MFHRANVASVSDVESMSAAEVTRALVAASNECERMLGTLNVMFTGLRGECNDSNHAQMGMNASRG